MFETCVKPNSVRTEASADESRDLYTNVVAILSSCYISAISVHQFTNRFRRRRRRRCLLFSTSHFYCFAAFAFAAYARASD